MSQQQRLSVPFSVAELEAFHHVVTAYILFVQAAHPRTAEDEQRLEVLHSIDRRVGAQSPGRAIIHCALTTDEAEALIHITLDVLGQIEYFAPLDQERAHHADDEATLGISDRMSRGAER